MSYVKIGVGGPVGSGKTALIEALFRNMVNDCKICVVTNDIYTKEDSQRLVNDKILPENRITGVETGGCPHTAIREDASMNFGSYRKFNKKSSGYGNCICRKWRR